MTAEEIVNWMLSNDAMSQWLGIELLEIKPGYAKIKMQVRNEMTNGFKIAHGGITFSFSDSCMAFAANAHGRHALSLDTSITHLKPVYTGDILTAESEQISLTNRTAVYHISVINQNNDLVSSLKGVMFRTEKNWTT